MKAYSISNLGLRLNLLITRVNAITAAGIFMLLLGAAGWLWGIPHLRIYLRDEQKVETAYRRQIEDTKSFSPAAVSADNVLSQFYDVLGENRYAEQQVKTFLAISNKAGLLLNKAEYKLIYEEHGHYLMYQIQLPVKGTYSSIRQFSEQILLAIPFASLDEIGIKRESISSNTLEARLRFTLYLDDETSASRKVTPAGADIS